ncbi:Hypothetical protein R9X50_00673900 [Acrodontium crateriforme]|uniref:Cytochrome P450 n=1 Tax=Acrodontium crateriforme TaxID=150365 RepID=A0AAQ3RBR6_9PEZI|nr:Hypothetical protein R9X50_00673900 [Acrodontium crateriforme]
MASPYVLALVGGVASHILYFNRFEHHMHGLLYLNTFLLAEAAWTIALNKIYGASLASAILSSALTGASFLTGAFTSTIIYRVFLSPLNKFPGPFGAKISTLHLSSQLGNSDAYYHLQKLHKKYGDYVRIGSNDLSIINPDLVEMAYGNNSKITKSSWYDGDAPLTSMHTSRDKSLHDKRRRMWAPAFSDKALRDYEKTIEEISVKTVQRFSEFKGEPINVTKWFNLYSFDIMGRLAFGKEYGFVDSGEKAKALELLSEGMQPLAFFMPTWLFRILISIPFLGAGFQKFVQFCIDELTWRVKNGDPAEKGGYQDIMSSILKAYKGIKNPEKDTMLQADARLIIVAGSDTTAAALTYLFYYLAKDPSQQKKIRDEVRPLTAGNWSDKDIRAAEHLNGAINEALRMHPPVPSGVSRLTPPEGVQVGDTYIPGNTVFWMPLYVMGRDERNFTNANSFIPERWTHHPEMIKHKDAFAPFLMGPFGCIGKNLALTELRVLTTRLLLRYEVALAPKEDGVALLTKSLDHFTIDLADLELCFRPVSG